MRTQKIIEDSINNIWEKFSFLTKNIPPLAVSSIPENAIIFIGINPSLSDFDRINLEKRINKKIDFYDLPSKDSDSKTYKYFNKFYEINRRLNIPIGHIDLLYFRETKQNKIKELLKSENGIAFIFKQLQVSRKVIDEIINTTNPKAFVVNNTLARNFLGRYKHEELYKNHLYNPIVDNSIHWINYFFDWDDKLGTYILSVKNRKIPFFFTSMLTGQRALDNGSFERLIWHLNFVIKKNFT